MHFNALVILYILLYGGGTCGRTHFPPPSVSPMNRAIQTIANRAEDMVVKKTDLKPLPGCNKIAHFQPIVTGYLYSFDLCPIFAAY